MALARVLWDHTFPLFHVSALENNLMATVRDVRLALLTLFSA